MSMLLWMSPIFHNISMILSQKDHQKAIPPPLDLKVASKALSLSTVSLEPWLCERTLAEQRLLREPPGSSTFQLVASTVQVPPSQPLRKRTTSISVLFLFNYCNPAISSKQVAACASREWLQSNR